MSRYTVTTANNTGRYNISSANNTGRYNIGNANNTGRYNISSAPLSRYGVQLAAPTASAVANAEGNPVGQRLTDILSSSLPFSTKLKEIFGNAGNNAVAVQYNNPTQINSLLDVLFNDKAIAANYGKSTAGNRIKALIDMNYAQRVAPMLAGKVWEPVLNTVQSLGETLDVVANPVKAMLATPNSSLFNGGDGAYFTDYDTAKTLYTNYSNGDYVAIKDNAGRDIGYRIKSTDGTYKTYNKKGLEVLQTIVTAGRTANIADMDTWERFKSAIGVGDHGRINYDITTNNLMTDILGELVVDPLNWVNLGVQAAETATKTAVKNAVRVMVKDAPEDMVDVISKIGEDKITAGVFKILQDKQIAVAAKDDTVKAVLEGFLKEASSDNLTNSYAVKNLKDAINAFLVTDKTFDLTPKQAADLVNRIGAASDNRMSLTLMRSLGTLQAGNNKALAVLTKATLDPVGVYPVSRLIKAGTRTAGRVRVAKYIADKLEGLTKPYQNTLGNVTIFSWEDLTEQTAKFNTKILDALTPDERAQYLTDGFVKIFIPQLEVDKIQIKHILNSEQSLADKYAAIQDYIKQAYRDKGTIEDIIAVEKNIADAVDNPQPFLDHIQLMEELQKQLDSMADRTVIIKDAKRTELIKNKFTNPVIDEIDDIHEAFINNASTAFRTHNQQYITRLYPAAKAEQNVPHTAVTEIIPITIDDLITAGKATNNNYSFKQVFSDAMDTAIDNLDSIRNELLETAFLDDMQHPAVSVVDTYLQRFVEAYGEFTAELRASLFSALAIDPRAYDEHFWVPAYYKDMCKYLDAGQYQALPAYKKILELNDEFDDALSDLAEAQFDAAKIMHPEIEIVEKSTGDMVQESIKRTGSFVQRLEKEQVDLADKLGLPREVVNSDTILANTPVAMPQVCGLFETPEFKALFDDIVRDDAIDLFTEVDHWWPTVLKSDTRFANDMRAYPPNRVAKIIQVFNDTDPEDFAEYTSAWTQLYNFLDSWRRALRNIHSTDIDFRTLDKAMNLLNQYSVGELIHTSAALTAWEDVDVLMQAQTFTMLSTLDPAGAVANFVRSTQDGEIGKTLRALKQAAEYGKGFFKDNPEKSAAFLAGFGNYERTIHSFECFEQLVYDLRSNCGFDERSYDAVLQAIAKVRNKTSSDVLDQDSIVAQLIKDMTNYDYYTKEATEPYNLEYIGFKNHDKLNELRVLNGFTPFSDDVAESHIAVEDALNNYLAYQQVLKKTPALAAEHKDKHKLFLDLESTNTSVYSTSNQIHSVAIVEMDDAGKILSRKTVALNPAKTDIYTSTDMLKELGIDHEQYCSNLAANSEELYDDEASMLTALRDWLLSDNGYNPENSVIITHNGKDFDLQLLRSKASANAVKLKAVNEKYETVYFTDFPDVDTLQALRQLDGMITINPLQEARLRESLTKYAADMDAAGCTKLFSAFDPQTFDAIGSMLPALNDIDPTLVMEYNRLRSDVFSYFSQIKQRNASLRKVPFFNKTIKEDNGMLFKEFLVSYARDVAKNPEMEARFMSLSTINSSTITSVMGSYPELAMKHFINTESIDRWFKATHAANRAAQGDLTIYEARMYHNMARQLDKYKSFVYDYDFTRTYSDAYKAAVNYFANTPAFKILNALDPKDDGVDNYAILQYIWSKYEPPELLKVAPGQDAKSTGFYQSLLACGISEHDAEDVLHILKNYNKISNPAKTNYARMFEGAESYRGYANMWASVKCQRAQLSDILKYEDAQGVISSSWRTTMKLLEPMYKFVDEVRSLDVFGLQAFERNDRLWMTRLSKARVARIANKLTLDNIVNELAIHSNGFIRLQRSLLDPEAYKLLLSKFNTDEARALGVHLFDDIKTDGYIWLTLGKEANITASVIDDAEKLSTVRFYSHGKLLEPVERESMLFTGLTIFRDDNARIPSERLMTIGGTIDTAVKTMDVLTDGASAGTTYVVMSRDRFDELVKQMPEQVQKNFDIDMFSSSAAFNKLNFDNSDLSFSNDPLSAKFCDSFSYTASYLGAEARYIQANFSDLTRVDKNCELGAAILKNPRKAAKWFAKNDTFVGVTLEARAKDGRPIIKSYNLSDPKQLAEAINKGAQIMDYTEYSTAYDVINNKLWSDSKWKAWTTFVRMYKIGYLSLNLGTVMRNAIDTIIKNEAETKTGLKMGQYYWEAIDRLDKFDRYADQIANLEISGNKAAEEAFFKGVKDMQYDEYCMLKKLMGIEVFGGEAHAFTKLSKNYQDKMLKAWHDESAIPTSVYAKYQTERKFYNAVSALLQPMSYVERVARYAEYYALADQGKTTAEIAAIVNRTHYDYTAKTAFEHTMERFIPFYTFQTRNLNHWLDLVDRNPQILVALRDILEPTWDIDSYDPDQIEHDKALQYHLMSGNIKLTDNLYLNTSFSMMDAVQRLLAYPKTIEGSIFSPVEAVIAAALQEGADDSYMAGNKVLSNWLQGTFGLKMTDQQVQDKYGEWTQNYYELTNYKASQGFMPELLDELKTWALVPFIGTQLNRFTKSATYLDDAGIIGDTLYLLGVANIKMQKEYNTTEHYVLQKEQYRTWLKSLGYDKDTTQLQLDQLKALYKQYTGNVHTESIGSQIYDLLQESDQNVYLYSRLKAAMGYAGKPLSELPAEAKESIYAAMTNSVDASPYIPVLQDVGVMTYLWKNLADKYEVDVNHWDKIPAGKLNAMYHDIARSVVEISEISGLLKDEKYRYAYSTAKRKLGYGDLKLSQLPCDSLSLIKAYMLGHAVTKQHSSKSYYSGHKRVYHTMSYAPQPGELFNRAHYLKGGTVTYAATDAAKYYVKSHYDAHRRNIYSRQYTSNGKMRQRLRMLPITPKNLQYRIQDNFWYMH